MHGPWRGGGCQSSRNHRAAPTPPLAPPRDPPSISPSHSILTASVSFPYPLHLFFLQANLPATSSPQCASNLAPYACVFMDITATVILRGLLLGLVPTEGRSTGLESLPALAQSVMEGFGAPSSSHAASSRGSGRLFANADWRDQRSPIATTALGLMGYQVPQLCDLMVKHWMDTVHALLRHESMTVAKLRGIVENVDTVFGELPGARVLELVEALLKASAQVKVMSLESSSDRSVYVRQRCSGSEGSDAAWAVEKVVAYVLKEKEDVYRRLSPIARLHVWRLRPSLLKADLSDLASEFMRCSSLFGKDEASECGGFGAMVASLALAPDVLDEVRHLLLKWSSSVGAMRLLELRTQVTAAVHDFLQHSNASGCAQPSEAGNV